MKMTKFYDNSCDDNRLCEICWAHYEPDYWSVTMDIYMINIHCQELRRNREARKRKNIAPKATSF